MNSRKKENKIEVIVFAASSELAQQLVENLFDNYPAELYEFNTVGGMERDLEKIYAQRPELIGIDPNRGYIYSEMYHVNCIYKYFN